MLLPKKKPSTLHGRLIYYMFFTTRLGLLVGGLLRGVLLANLDFAQRLFHFVQLQLVIPHYLGQDADRLLEIGFIRNPVDGSM